MESETLGVFKTRLDALLDTIWSSSVVLCCVGVVLLCCVGAVLLCCVVL